MSAPDMTGRRFHRTTPAIPRRPWKSKSPFASRPLKTSIKKGTRGVRTRYDTVLPPFISDVRFPGRPVILVPESVCVCVCVCVCMCVCVFDLCHFAPLKRGCASSGGFRACWPIRPPTPIGRLIFMHLQRWEVLPFLTILEARKGIPKNFSSQVLGEVRVNFLRWIPTETLSFVNRRSELFRKFFLGRLRMILCYWKTLLALKFSASGV